MGEKEFRNKIYWLTFLFSILVIWVHSYNAELFLGSGEDARSVEQYERILGDGLGQIAVPGFFMVSSYLFYRNFSWDKLLEKWNSRIRSILAPYLIWNFLYYAAYGIAARLPFPEGFWGKGPVPLEIGELVRALFHYAYNPVFWYLHQLILLIFLAPLLFAVLRYRLSGTVLLLTVGITLWNNWNIPYLNMDALFYYSAAALAAIHRKNWGKFVEKEISPQRALGSVCIFGLVLFLLKILGSPGCFLYGRALSIVLIRVWGVCAAWFLVKLCRLPEAKEFMKHNFFLYAIHFPFVRLLNKTAAWLFPASSGWAFLVFFLMPLFMVIASSWLGKALRTFWPAGYRLLSGGR